MKVNKDLEPDDNPKIEVILSLFSETETESEWIHKKETEFLQKPAKISQELLQK